MKTSNGYSNHYPALAYQLWPSGSVYPLLIVCCKPLFASALKTQSVVTNMNICARFSSLKTSAIVLKL